MKISVVIPSKDSPTLLNTLASLAASAARATSVSLEVLVVDSSATPPAINRDLGDRISLTLISKDLTLLEARATGIEAASGDVLLNLDSDQTVHPDLLPSLARSTSPSVVIPEFPPGTDRWTGLVRRANQRTLSLFRRRPSLDIPVIPRLYRRQPLMNAVGALRDDAAQRTRGRLPTRHEDTILFAYFLKVNRWRESECVGFVDVPIYHAVPPLPEVGRKYYHYGRDLGRESRGTSKGELTLDPTIWRMVYRVDYSRILRYWDTDLGPDLEGMAYDLFRTCFYGAGIMSAYVWRSEPIGSGSRR